MCIKSMNAGFVVPGRERIPGGAVAYVHLHVNSYRDRLLVYMNFSYSGFIALAPAADVETQLKAKQWPPPPPPPRYFLAADVCVCARARFPFIILVPTAANQPASLVVPSFVGPVRKTKVRSRFSAASKREFLSAIARRRCIIFFPRRLTALSRADETGYTFYRSGGHGRGGRKTIP